jgi:hypothetical protein
MHPSAADTLEVYLTSRAKGVGRAILGLFAIIVTFAGGETIDLMSAVVRRTGTGTGTGSGTGTGTIVAKGPARTGSEQILLERMNRDLERLPEQEWLAKWADARKWDAMVRGRGTAD